MTLIRTVIVDDEPWARDRLKQMVQRHEEIEVIHEAEHGIDAVEAIERLQPDLVFLDIQMPELDGFEVIEQVGVDRMPPTIFVTAYEQYAIRAFDVNAVDYLLKPFDQERFDQALAKLNTRYNDPIQRQAYQGRIDQLLSALDHRPTYLTRIIVKEQHRLLLVHINDISWIEAAGNYAALHTSAGEHLVRKTMKELELKLDPDRFARIHRSTIVNLDHVVELRPLFSGEYEVLLSDRTTLTLSKSYKAKLKQFLS